MDFLTRFGLNKSRLTILVMVGLLLQGLITYGGLPKRENPAITIRSAIVTAQFPGMSPERMEDLIVTPLERAVREIGEVEDIQTLISTGFAKLELIVYDDVPKAEIDQVFQDIRNKMSDVAGDLPEGTIGPDVNTNFGDVSIATIAVTGDGFSYRELKDSGDDLREDLYKLDGISKVTIFGEQEERIWLELDSRKLASVGVQVNQVLDDLRAQNVILPAGELNSNGTTLILEANGDLDSVEAVGEVLTKVQGLSGFVRLRDLMTVRRGYQEPHDKPVFFNGQPAVMLAVEMSDSQDVQKIGVELKDRVKAYEQTQPIGISYTFSTFQETAVTESINAALINVLQTFAVVILVMMVFLGLRVAFVIACIVPFTLMFALMGMSQMGIDLHQISIAAVIISLGLLVDNGLVVVEEIQSRIAKGVPAEEAAVGAGGQFFAPLAVASITTISAFTPMFILNGTEGEFAFSLGAVVGLMLFGSWVTAHYILPFLCVSLLKENKDAEPKGDSKLVVIYRSVISKILPFGIPIILLAYFTVFLSTNVFGWLRSEMFPLSERAEYMIYLDMPKGTAIERTEEEALAVEQWLLDKDANSEVVNTTVYVGDGGPRFYLALSPADTNPSSAFILVNTKDAAGAVVAGNRAKKYLLENHPSARFKVKRLSMGGAESGIVEIKIKGPELDKLLALAKEVEGAFSTVPGIGQNENNWGNKSLKMVIDIAQNKARELGVTSEEISDVMDTYFSGTSYSTFRDGSESIPIVLRASENFRDSLEDLANLSIPAGGQLISLDQVATFRPQLEYSQFRRENQERQIIISGKSETLDAASVVALIQPTLDGLDLSGGHELEIGGETESSAETNEKLGAGLPLGLTIMLLALMFQFNSARRVILTFMTIPLIITGAPLALYITGQPMSFFAILGLISLMGIIINNAIVLIDQIDIERKTMDLYDAIVEAAGKRVTPIILTSLTTVLGLVPMAISGGALFEPMATLMIGGLLLSSVMSLFFVPSAYYLFFRYGKSKV
ncbi:efflux RND transporter permease subunit [Amylibacter sp. SFDW26]|uniref:efflux RND transporter permease subunit n=1 Tax=Amylibacter sp. SFDW26 TaxID=2652722 RepID=UPI0012628B81|nr:efflux RND transporter permease subunit [Amylibacter sp. SFDW26]KAB7614389.1 efflux RND transporter permease subunit [Amylibacter sp. SFDW26]